MLEELFKGVLFFVERLMVFLLFVLRDFEFLGCLIFNGFFRVFLFELVFGGRGCIVVCVVLIFSCVLDDFECKLVVLEKDF